MKPSHALNAMFRLLACLCLLVLVAGIGVAMPVRQAFAQTVTYNDTDNKKKLENPSDTYVIQGNGSMHKGDNHFTVPSGKSSERSPIRITLKNVNISQDGQDPSYAFITVEKDNYVIVSLDGTNTIIGGENEQVGDNNGMAAINVDEGSTLKVTSSSGDGSTNGKLVAKGGGSKYGGAGIGSNFYYPMGNLIIAGGTIEATGAHCAAGIGGGRDSEVGNITITGGKITAWGGEYGAGIGAGDHFSGGDGGDLSSLTISGGEITAKGGKDGAGIGGGEGSNIRGNMLISGGTITATGGEDGAGIGAGQHGTFMRDASSKDCTLKITGGTIKATGGENGAGIGGGDGTSDPRVIINQANANTTLNINAKGGPNGAGIGAGNGTADYVDITLHGGTIVATGGNRAKAGKCSGAGIGGGGDVSRIDIKGSGTIEAYGGLDAAGIGGGESGSVTGHLTIDGDTDGRHGTRGQAAEGSRGLAITAIASKADVDNKRYDDNEAAAIGGGKASGGNITVKNAIIKSCAHHEGADIGGGGYHGIWGGTIDTIQIDNCDIQSSSFHKVTSAIGSGYGGSINHINIANTTFNGGGIGASLIDVNYLGLSSIKSITIDNSDIHAYWDETNPGVASGNVDVTSNFCDHGAAGIGSGQYGSMDEITITNSKIYAHGFGSGAGIGGGGGGGHTAWIGLDKFDIGDVGTITISGSDVEAVSGYGDFTEKSSVKIGEYDEYEIPLADLGSGAGIGGGGGAGVDVIDIHDCGTVNCISFSGTGIGGGCGSSLLVGGWVNHIYLDNCKDVDARGGSYCAGIGTGGGDGLRAWASCTLQEIYINNCPDVYAQAGSYAAGIGCGMSSPFDAKAKTKMGAGIAIHNSNVEAHGGLGGAGIGGGAEQSKTGLGGDGPSVLIKGGCRVDAYGGGAEQAGTYLYYPGAAGIGGGSDGGSTSPITIDVTEDETTAKGTLEDPTGSKYYVHAVGKDGGAGIGSGGSTYSEDSLSKGDNDFESTITIKGGAVFAKGGRSFAITSGHDKYNGMYMGAGAGIGGGSAEGTVDEVIINGGFIRAKAGDNHANSDRADDIGSGGDWSIEDPGDRDRSRHLLITDGTVLADRLGNFTEPLRIGGGSVRCNTTAYLIDSSLHSYWHSAKLIDNPLTKVNVTSWTSYGTKSIYTDENNKVYLYLQAKGNKNSYDQWADIEVGGEKRHYYGYTDYNMGQTTSTSNNSVLKMDGGIVGFKEPKDAHYGADFALELDDGAESLKGATWEFAAKGAASLVGDGKVTSPGAKLTLHGDAVGAFTVEGTSSASADPEIYWNSKAKYVGTTKRGIPQVEVIEDPSKEYDGEQVENPAVQTNSAGTVSYTYYKDDGTKLDGPPTDAGTYTVVATVAQEKLFEEGSSSPYEFKITPRMTVSTLEMALDPSDNAVVVLTATVHGLLDADGTVAFKYNSTQYPYERTTEPQEVTQLANGMYGVHFDASNIIASDYRVHAVYTPGEKGNYKESTSEELSGHKDYADRHILDEVNNFSYVKTYGDPQFSFTLSTDHPTPEQNDEWDWGSIASDVYDSQFGDEHTITPSKGSTTGTTMPTVTINHVGDEVLNVGLVDGRSALGDDYMYNRANHNVTVSVLPKDLTVQTDSATRAYDGTELTADGRCDGLVNDEEVAFDVTGSQTDAGSSSNTYAIDWNSSETTAKSANYHVVESLGTLTVTPRPTTLVLELSKDGTNATAKATVENFVSADVSKSEVAGQVTFTFATKDGKVEPDPCKITYDNPVASVIGAGVAAGDYVVTATFTPSEGNYQPSTTTVTGHNPLEPREIKGDRLITTTYGEEPFPLGLSVDPDQTRNGDNWFYVVEETDPAVTIDPDGKVTINHVGQTVVHVTVQDTNEDKVYEDAHAYVVIVVLPAPLTVTTDSATRVYDGTELIADGKYEGLVNDETLQEFKTTGTQTNAGSSSNEYEITWGTSDGQAQQANYKVAESLGTLRVTPKPTTTTLALSQSGSSATVTATIGGFIDGVEGPVGSVEFWVDDECKGSVDVSRAADGTCVVTKSFDNVPADNYTVKAEFTPDGDANNETSLAHNYLSSTASATGSKSLARRTIQGKRAYQKTYGDDYDGADGSIDTGFLLDLSLADDVAGPNDTWSFSVIYDSRNVAGLGPSAEVASSTTGRQGNAQVTVNHAGTVVIRATVVDGRDEGEKIWNDATAYVVVNIDPVPLTVTSFAYDKGDNSKTPVTSVRYGQIDKLLYDLKYEGLLPGDNPGNFTTVNGKGHGTLTAMPLVTTLGASDMPRQIGIARVAPEGEGGKDAGRFFSCNYAITYDTTTNAVTVTKAPLAIQALDTGGKYGGDEPAYGWDVASNQSDNIWKDSAGVELPCAGLVPWDTTESVFEKRPTIQVDKGVTGGKAYKELDAATYPRALVLSGGISQNYGICAIAGNLVVNPANLSDKARFDARVENAVYNAEEQTARITVVDKAFDPARTLEQDAQYKVSYLTNHTDAGTAYVLTSGMGGNYTGRQLLDFEIEKAPGSVVTESAVKVYDGEALTASGTVTGILEADQHEFKTTGTQTDPGISRNTYDLTFQNPAKANNYAVDESLGRLAVVSNDAKDFLVSDVVDYTYDGTEHKQVVTVRNHLLQKLVEGEDYTLAYEGDLVNAGTVNIVINGVGAYTGSVTRTYKIEPAKLMVHTFDDAKVYDGTPLVGEGEVWRLVGDETVTLTVTGTQTEVGSSSNTYTLTWDGTAKEGNYVVHERVGTLTVNAPDTVYYCESGADGVWTKGSSETLGFVYKRTWDDETTFDHFKGLSIDGKPVSAEGYEARRGSVVVDLLPSYLETLDTGGHTLTTEFDDGDAVTTAFTVREAANEEGNSNVPSENGDAGGLMGGSVSRTATPQTGDYATPALFVALVLSIVGAVLCVLSRRFT